jgi:hypothetical protein
LCLAAVQLQLPLTLPGDQLELQAPAQQQ